jgi:hypothetical protein
VGSLNILIYSDEKKEKGQFRFKKAKKREIKICEGNKLKKHLCIANKRHITENNENLLKAIN